MLASRKPCHVFVIFFPFAIEMFIFLAMRVSDKEQTHKGGVHLLSIMLQKIKYTLQTPGSIPG
jgi:hypothetical protein